MTLIKLIKRILYHRVSPEKMRHREYQRVMQGEILKHLGKETQFPKEHTPIRWRPLCH